MYSKFVSYLRLLRITSWVKNLFVFVPAVFSKHIFEAAYFSEVLLAFVAFSVASSLVYTFNDVIDIDRDKIHPVKSKRPLAKGDISKNGAILFIPFLFIILILLSFEFNVKFNLILWFYVLLNVLYSIWLKHIVIVDIFSIAFGFMLRVFSGAFVIDVYISNWLILTTIFLSLFLAVMKRRVEIAQSPNPESQRFVLKDYSITFIDQITAIAAGGVIICYALYSVAERTVKEYGSEALVFTTLFVIFGIFRYMFLVYKKDLGENVAEVLVSDWQMILNAILFVITVVYIIYFRNQFPIL